jgi:hypothetical protein
MLFRPQITHNSFGTHPPENVAWDGKNQQENCGQIHPTLSFDFQLFMQDHIQQVRVVAGLERTPV